MVHSYTGTHGVKKKKTGEKKNSFRQYPDSAGARALKVEAS